MGMGTAGMRNVAGRIETALKTGFIRMGADCAGTVAGESMQQVLPAQCMGALAIGRDWPQVMPMGIAGMDMVVGGGQQSIVGRLLQARWSQALSARTGWAESVRVRSRATNWSSFFMRCLNDMRAGWGFGDAYHVYGRSGERGVDRQGRDSVVEYQYERFQR
jgi:hypothetical protein